MNNQITPVTDDEEEIAGKKLALSGKEGLALFTAELREKGVELPSHDVWKYLKRPDVEVSMHAAFTLLGGLPGLALWAHKNQTQFYTAYMKLAGVESTIGTTGNIFINTTVPESALDAIEIDAQGRIKDFK